MIYLVHINYCQLDWFTGSSKIDKFISKESFIEHSPTTWKLFFIFTLSTEIPFKCSWKFK